MAAPILVSLALIGFGIVFAYRSTRGVRSNLKPWHWLPLIAGGLVVIASFTLDAGHIRDGAMPSGFAWPVFLFGMALALYGACRITLRK